MKWRLTALACFMTVSISGVAGELPDELFGIALGSEVGGLTGEKTRGNGITVIRGVEYEMYLADARRYVPARPLTHVRVSVERATGRISGVGGTAGMERAQCREAARMLRAKAEELFGITFGVLQHQGDEFYTYMSGGRLMAIGCQGGHGKALLQYQLDLVRE